MGALALGIAAFFLPWALLSPVIAGGGPLTRCAPSCPENVLQLGSAPGLVEAAGKAETYAALAITVAVVVVYAMRLRAASRPQRRALTAVAVTSLLFLPAYFAFNFSAWILYLDQETLDTLAWGIVGTRVLLPLGFLIALLQAQRFGARALQGMLERLAGRPTPEQWRETIAVELDDPGLRLGYYDPHTKRFRESDGSELARRAERAARGCRSIAAAGRWRRWWSTRRWPRIPSWCGPPRRRRSWRSRTVTSRASCARHARGSWRPATPSDDASSATCTTAPSSSSSRCGSTSRSPASGSIGSEEQAMLERLGGQVDDAIEELRGVAHGIYPSILADRGVGQALKAVARSSATSVRVADEWRGRPAEAVETTVYFCCLECLQNAAKHAGPGASATIRLFETDGHISFSVEDDGNGFDLGDRRARQRLDQPRGPDRRGRRNAHDRLGAWGGHPHHGAYPPLTPRRSLRGSR